MPLTAEDTDAAATNSRSNMDHAELNSSNSDEDPSIQLTAVFVLNGAPGGKNTATVVEEGVSRSVSVGDTVAGMEIVEIRRGEIVLRDEAEKHIMKLGTLFKAKPGRADDKAGINVQE